MMRHFTMDDVNFAKQIEKELAALGLGISGVVSVFPPENRYEMSLYPLGEGFGYTVKLSGSKEEILGVLVALSASNLISGPLALGPEHDGIRLAALAMKKAKGENPRGNLYLDLEEEDLRNRLQQNMRELDLAYAHENDVEDKLADCLNYLAFLLHKRVVARQQPAAE